MKPNLFGEQLFHLRRRKRMLQKQIALGAGVDPSYLAALENGRRDPPRASVIEKILDALAATPGEGESLRRVATLTHLMRQMASHDGVVPGLETALRMLELAPRLSANELAALDTLVDSLSQRPIAWEKEAAM